MFIIRMVAGLPFYTLEDAEIVTFYTKKRYSNLIQNFQAEDLHRRRMGWGIFLFHVFLILLTTAPSIFSNSFEQHPRIHYI